jgi:RNA polymerase sigma factor for flagellar operon FliA
MVFSHSDSSSSRPPRTRFMARKLHPAAVRPDDPTHSELKTFTSSALWRLFEKRPLLSVRDVLFERYKFLAEIAAGAYMHRKMPYRSLLDYDDLLADAQLGLVDAIHAYSLRRRASFKTFSFPRIRGSIIDGLRNLEVFPRIIAKVRRDLKPYQEEFWHRFNREATLEELVELYPEARIAKQPIRVWRNNPLIMVNVFNQFEDKSQDSRDQLEMCLHRHAQHRMRKCDDSVNRMDTITKILQILQDDQEEQHVIYLYYFSGMTYPQISKVTKLSSSWVSIKRNSAIVKLQRETWKNNEFAEMLYSVL